VTRLALAMLLTSLGARMAPAPGSALWSARDTAAGPPPGSAHRVDSPPWITFQIPPLPTLPPTVVFPTLPPSVPTPDLPTATPTDGPSPTATPTLTASATIEPPVTPTLEFTPTPVPSDTPSATPEATEPPATATADPATGAGTQRAVLPWLAKQAGP